MPSGLLLIFEVGQVYGGRLDTCQTRRAVQFLLAEVEPASHSRDLHRLGQLANDIPVVLHGGDIVTAILIEQKRVLLL